MVPGVLSSEMYRVWYFRHFRHVLLLYTTHWGVWVPQMPHRKLRNDMHEFRGLKDQPWREIKIPTHQGQILQISYNQEQLTTSKRWCGWYQVIQSQAMVAENKRGSSNGNGKPNQTKDIRLKQDCRATANDTLCAFCMWDDKSLTRQAKLELHVCIKLDNIKPETRAKHSFYNA